MQAGLPVYTETGVTELLRQAKKTDSRVKGDPLPHLVRGCPEGFAAPLANIYNKINHSSTWPKAWKTEYLTVIPKNPNPGDLSECRNISCTALFSKVMENQLLQQLRQELVVDPEQFGGAKGCGAEHLLAELWDKVHETVEGGLSAAVLLGVDFEKAFNRMDHAIYLQELRALGASEGSVSLVRAFLENRRMTISFGNHGPEPVLIEGGSPQGSGLGCLLYCITTQRLTLGLQMRRPLNPENVNLIEPTHEGEDESQGSPQAMPDLAGGPIHFFRRGGLRDDDTAFWETPTTTGDSGSEDEVVRPPIEDVPVLLSFKYIDDTTVFLSAELTSAQRHFTRGTTLERFETLPIGGILDDLAEKSGEIGMKINTKKTQLPVISPSNGCITLAITTVVDGTVITSQASLKLVGFHFGTTPGVQRQVEELQGKFRRKIWMIYHLREAGIKGDNLFKMYCCYVRAVLEYCSPVYHSMLTKGQGETLERMHRLAIRVCYGFRESAREVMAARGIETLEARRIRRCDKFICKAASSPVFGPKWFRRRAPDLHNLRRRREIVEERASSQRRFNSLSGPLSPGTNRVLLV